MKIAENRDKIFQFFDQAPIILDQAEKTHRYLPHDTVLNDRLTELRTTVVLGLCGLLRILQPSHKRAGRYGHLSIAVANELMAGN